LYESTGLNGSSTLRKTELTTGKVLTQIHLPDAFFGEGTTILDGKIYQLTWQSHRGLIYDFDTFVKLGEFSYKGEGWGLTTDGHSLIMSDGTNNLRFLDPTRFTIQRTIAVLSQDKPLTKLNELEYVNGEIYANIWQTDQVARIDPKTGRLLGLIDFGGLLSPEDRDDRTDVLNGIAYDPQGKRLFVTGKNWPKLFQVTIKSAP
jgi:glutamine cyclotransferase